MSIEQLKQQIEQRLAEVSEYHTKFVTYWEAVSEDTSAPENDESVAALGAYLYGDFYDGASDYPVFYDAVMAEEEGHLLGQIDAYEGLLRLIEGEKQK